MMPAVVHPRVREQMQRAGVDVLVLCGETNIAYAIDVLAQSREPARAGACRRVAVVHGDDAALFAPGSLDLDAGAGVVAAAVADLVDGHGVVAIDEFPSLVLRDVLARFAPVDAAPLLAAAKIVKTPDEVERIRGAQLLNDRAMDAVAPVAVPGATQHELSAAFYRAAFSLGATGNTVDPVWDVVPPARAALFSLTDDLPFPTPSTGRILEPGDVIFTDTGIDLDGWASDVGRTWIAGSPPTARQRDQAARWFAIRDACTAVIRPGATAADVARAATAANGGVRPWFPHLYVAHGVGTDSAELPFCGTDLGPEVEDRVVLEPGVVLVLEPVVWDEGHGGYRAEEIVVVTDDGCAPLLDGVPGAFPS
jgi:Xaa-Pro aminopeptidase